MSLLKRYVLKTFDEKEVKDRYEVMVPVGGILMDAMVAPDCIALWYKVSDIYTTSEPHYFKILKPDEIIPEDAEFVKILDIVISPDPSKPEVQGVVVFPIFKLKK